MAAGHDGMPLARRTAIGLAALTIAALSGVLLPTGARAGVVPLAVVTDKRSHDPHSHGPSPTPTRTEPPTPGPTTPPPTTDPPGSPPPGTPPPGGSPTTTPGQPGLPPPPPGGQAGGPAAPPGAPGGGSGSQSTGDDPVLLGRNLTPADPDAGALSRNSDPVPDAAPALAVTDTVRLAGAAVPLWLVVGGGAFLVILVAVGLVLTLRDRDNEPAIDGLGIMDPPDPPATVRFG